MIGMPGQEGLHPDQAPPLTVPLAFFLTVPLAMTAAGLTLLLAGDAALLTPWAPTTIALTHMGTLGVLGMAMLGALYQMIPVVAGATVPWPRLGHAVHALFATGTISLCTALLRPGPPLLFGVALVLLAAALGLFLGPVTWAIWRAPTRSSTVTGMRMSLGSLVVVVLLGLLLSWQYAAMDFAAQRAVLLQWHLSLGLLGWVGGLVTAVSWQVAPMFYLARATPSRQSSVVLVLLGAGLALCCAGGFAAPLLARHIEPSTLLALAALPAALAVWVVGPGLLWQSLRARRRPRADPSLRAWQAALCCAPAVLLCAGLATGGGDPRWNLAFGWLAVWGWAGLAVHGMLTRIVPFLLWFHRFSHLVGLQPVPPMNRLMPEGAMRTGLLTHALGLACGLGAIGSGSGLLARAAGLCVCATGLCLGYGFVQALRQRAAAPLATAVGMA